MSVSWALLWTVRTYWNPVFFFGMWTGGAMLVRALQGAQPFPLPRYPALMALSIPLWWWFELVNSFVQNWQYQGAFRYNELEYNLFATLAFSTVIPALDAAWSATLSLPKGAALRVAHPDPLPAGAPSAAWCWWEVALGFFAQALVFTLPTYFYGLVWVAPFLALDGLAGLAGGVNLAYLLRLRRYAMPLAIGLAGVGCGFFWEFWNFWADPKWTYSIPYFHFLQVFEMPLLGYGGYVPFAWSVYQLVWLAEWGWGKITRAAAV